MSAVGKQTDHEGQAIMNFEELTPEQQAKARDCKTPEDMLALAKELGHALTDEELESVSGGASWDCTSDCSDHTPCSQNR